MINLSRKINFINQKYVEAIYSDSINSETIEKLNFLKLKKVFSDEDQDLKEVILHNAINDWVNENYEETITFLNKLKRIIKRTRIYLNILEEQNIQLLEERIFSKDRHIKILLVEKDLEKNENAGAKFTNANLFRKKRLLRKTMNGELVLTNYKIIFSEDKDVKKFRWKNISKIEYKNYGFLFNYDDKEYVIRVHDQSSLNNTIENFLSKKVREKGWTKN